MENMRASISIGTAIGGAGGCDVAFSPSAVQSMAPVPEVLQHIDLQLDELFTQIDRVCCRVSPACANNPLQVPQNATANGMKDAVQPSELLSNLREKLNRIEHMSSVLMELQRQLQI